VLAEALDFIKLMRNSTVHSGLLVSETVLAQDEFIAIIRSAEKERKKESHLPY
jgi:hypothetical protein